MISRMIRFRFMLLSLALVAISSAQEEKLPNAAELLNKAEPHLLKTNGEKAVLKPELRKKHVLIYWSAGWCGPCRKFTPDFIKYYNEQGGGKDFEVIMVSVDKGEENMWKYVRGKKMPWLHAKFSERRNIGFKAYAKGGIPRMMIIDGEGEVFGRGHARTIFNQFKEIRGQ